ncbi:MAG: glycosyltransferase [Thermodesulfobacteriota bacterium]|nr:glycosyltransferase [Thermodesulfobacteriota bacterium]
MSFKFSALPEQILAPLLLGSAGKVHLMRLAKEALTLAGRPGQKDALFLFRLGADFLFAAWESDPLDGYLAGQLANLNEKHPLFEPQTAKLPAFVAGNWNRPENINYYNRLLERGQSEKISSYLQDRMKKEKSLFWLQKYVEFAKEEQDFDGMFTALERQRKIPAAVLNMLKGRTHFLCREFDKAGHAFELALKEHALPETRSMLAETILCQGKRDRAIQLWGQCLKEWPWRTNLILKMYDVARGLDVKSAPLKGKVRILLYTYNKAHDLDHTLESLAGSGADTAFVHILNNGCTDHTGEVIEKWRKRLGPDRVRQTDMPTNIGAPAARNWLTKLEEVRDSDWIVFVDDDVELPPGWLGRLGAAVETYPDARVWGCKVRDFSNPGRIQNVDLHLVPPLEDSVMRRLTGQKPLFEVSNLHHQDMDFGQFNYLRPCVSVTGCCHLFRTKTLISAHGFDLRFSPTQFDDLDFDLGLNLRGGHAVYQGHLEIPHRKETGKSSERDLVQSGNAHGNFFKLQKKYSQGDVQKIKDADFARLGKDLLAKLDSIAGP